MFNRIKKTIACIAIIATVTTVNAQPTAAESLDMMRSNGKIYVVVAIVVTILLGMFIYLFSLDRKISKIEKDK